VSELNRLLHGSHFGLASAAQEMLRHLMSDDSRRVAKAARHSLDSNDKTQQSNDQTVRDNDESKSLDRRDREFKYYGWPAVIVRWIFASTGSMSIWGWGIGGVVLSLLAFAALNQVLDSQAPPTPTLITKPEYKETSTLAFKPTPTWTPRSIPSPTWPPNMPPPNASPGDIWIRPKDEAKMVYVPAGTFLMGSSESDEDASQDELPQNSLTLDAFWMDQHEVTNSQFAVFLNSQGNQEECGVTWLEAESDYVRIHQLAGVWRADTEYVDHPVVEVSWYGAKAYAQWVGGRLPTEAEWEKAVRGTYGQTYPWGNENPECSLSNYSGCIGNTTPVGSYPDGASPYGALDMAGNVWEWTESLWGEKWLAPEFKYPYDPADGRENIDAGCEVLRVLRGGAFTFSQRGLRCAFRGRNLPIVRDGDYGFRVCFMALDK
jgi:formylglycine-generating enzyme required for sulfatase activity